jgi:hypothetical protein
LRLCAVRQLELRVEHRAVAAVDDPDVASGVVAHHERPRRRAVGRTSSIGPPRPSARAEPASLPATTTRYVPSWPTQRPLRPPPAAMRSSATQRP